MTTRVCFASLAPFLEAGVLTPLDAAFADAVVRLAGHGAAEAWTPVRWLAAAMAARAPRHGHVCVSLTALAHLVRDERPDTPTSAPLPWPTAPEVLRALTDSPLIAPGGPLVLRGDGLSLARYDHFEAQLAAAVSARLAPVSPPEPARLAASLERLWGPGGTSAGDLEQKRAAARAVSQRFAVIVGGPGTGKTTTVVRILALLLEQWPTLRIGLLAPTGKAAARLSESVRGALGRPEAEAIAPEIRASMPLVASTIHRALGIRPDDPSKARHHREHPLPFDALVVDEASMIPLALMTRLLDAVPEGARVILLGDQHQLASVEAGAVLADLCGPEGAPDWPLAPAIARLSHSRRFRDDGGIGQLARAVKAGDAAAVEAVLHAPQPEIAAPFPRPVLSWLRASSPQRLFDALCVMGVEHAVRCLRPGPPPAGVLARADEVRLLCAHRRGLLGVERLNAEIGQAVARRFGVRFAPRIWGGLPFLVTENDNELGVFNGDTGVFLPDPAYDGRLRAFLPQAGSPEQPRSLDVSRLPAWEPVFAMTIHKSQGSEFGHAIVVLPEAVSPIVTRELVYTGITRARDSVTLAAETAVLRAGIAERVVRATGLSDRFGTMTPSPSGAPDR
jgi:exodeoxyribonuclease V alpha subunit